MNIIKSIVFVITALMLIFCLSPVYAGNHFPPLQGDFPGYLSQAVIQSSSEPGQVWAWGRNNDGQLGYPAGSGAYPVQVDIEKADSIAAGKYHNLALNDGQVWAWGLNNEGQLGDGTHLVQYRPAAVLGLNNITFISAGAYHSLALKSDGTVWAWGANDSGQLGDETCISSSLPVQVRGLEDVIAVAAGAAHSLAVTSNGTVWAWGDNYGGQLGTGNQTGSAVPVPVSGLSGVSAVAAGDSFSLALRFDGTVWAWGQNYYGQLGNGTVVDSSLPVEVSGLNDITDIAAGTGYCLAVKADGTVWAWGVNNAGQLGNGQKTGSLIPVLSGLPGKAAAAAAGNTHSLLLMSDHTVWAWGTNDNGRLGNGTYISSNTPVEVSLSSPVKAVAAGDLHSLALTSEGTVWAWGDNDIGQLGTPTCASSPLQVAGFSQPISVAAGSGHSLALTSDGMVWSWGANNAGQLGNGTFINSDVPVQVSGLNDVVYISSGGYHNLALRSDGTVWAWGHGSYGQLGSGSPADSNIPLPVSSLSGVIAVECGSTHSLALKADGTVWAWGSNLEGQLGIGTRDNSAVPVQVSGLSGVIAISGGGAHSLALKADGTVWVWGANNAGQLGIGDRKCKRSELPVQVSLLNGVKHIESGNNHNLATGSDGLMWAWGGNGCGQLGDGSTSDKYLPLQVNLLTGITTLAAGTDFNLALKSDGTVWAWGSNLAGQLGNGTYEDSRYPVQVNGLTGVTCIAAGKYHSQAVQPEPPVPTVVSLKSSINPSEYGQNVTFSVSIISNIPSGYTPTGCLVIRDEDTTLAAVELDSAGKANFTTSALAVGSHSVTAVYAGDDHFAGSASPPLIQVVTSFPAYPPMVTRISPADRSSGVPLDSLVVLYFSKPMDRVSTQSAFRLSPVTGNSSVSGNFSWNLDSTVMTFAPVADLSLDFTYTVELSTVAEDIYGIPLVQAFSSLFITSSVSVDINVALQGGSRPDSGWNVPLEVRFYRPGDTFAVDISTAGPVYSFSLDAGKKKEAASARLSGIVPDTYDITVSSPHCLTNLKRNVLISASTVKLDMGLLPEGDANQNGVINIQDFGILAAAYGAQRGQPLYDERADFDRNNVINVVDFGLLAANYGKKSPVDIPLAVPVSPGTPVSAKTGDTLEIAVNIGHVINLAAYQFDLEYDSQVLMIPGEEGGEAVSAGCIHNTEMPVDGWAYRPLGSPGKIRVIGHLPAPQAVTGEGYLTKIRFSVVGSAGQSSALVFSNFIVLDMYPSEIDITVQDGLITVAGGQ